MRREVSISGSYSRELTPREREGWSAGGPDAEVAALAAQQHGVVGRAQLRAIGLTLDEIEGRLRRKQLHRMHQSVYAVGHRLVSRLGRWMAAVLAAGPGAALSHRDAAALHGLRPSSSRLIEVTAPRRRRRPGLRIYRAKLAGDEVAVVEGVPVTGIHRTLLDLATVVPRARLDRALERADALSLTDPLPLAALLERHRGRRGTRSLAEALADGVRPASTRSELEDAFLSFLDAHRLPRPEVNTWTGEMEVDFRWPQHSLIVEVDGRDTHATSAAFERDRARDRKLQAAGWRVVRITWRQLHVDAEAVADDLAKLLGYRFAPWPRQLGE
jgi:very-short-patch-repair endonuclease